MKNSKVWMIIGASEGLGPAAVRYLLSKQQTIVAVLKDTADTLEIPVDNQGTLYLVYLTDENESSFSSVITGIVALHGKIDMLINNFGYSLMDVIKANGLDKAENLIAAAVMENGLLIRTIVLFLKKEPESRLINLPPRFCSMEETDPFRLAFIEHTRDRYLQALKLELNGLNIIMRFIEPGDKLFFESSLK